jgi:hypothetical protein
VTWIAIMGRHDVPLRRVAASPVAVVRRETRAGRIEEIWRVARVEAGGEGAA